MAKSLYFARFLRQGAGNAERFSHERERCASFTSRRGELATGRQGIARANTNMFSLSVPTGPCRPVRAAPQVPAAVPPAGALPAGAAAVPLPHAHLAPQHPAPRPGHAAGLRQAQG